MYAKTMLIKIKENLNKWRHTMFVYWKTKHCIDGNSLLTCRFNKISI